MDYQDEVIGGRFCRLSLDVINPRTIPVIDTDFWKWLEHGGYVDYRVDAIRLYLEDRQGHARGHQTIDTLKTIYSHFAWMLYRDFSTAGKKITNGEDL